MSKRLIQSIDSIFDNSLTDCHKKNFHIFDHICEYDINFTTIINNERVNFTIFDKNMSLYEINKKLKIARENGFMFNQINNFEIKIFSHLSNFNI